jgi:hypothetical protein
MDRHVVPGGLHLASRGGGIAVAHPTGLVVTHLETFLKEVGVFAGIAKKL